MAIDKSLRQHYDNEMLVKKRADNKRPVYQGLELKGHPIYGTERPEWFNKQFKYQGEFASEAEKTGTELFVNTDVDTGYFYVSYIDQDWS